EVRERHSFDFRIFGALRTLVTDRRIDIIHSHDYKTDLLASWVARRTPAIPISTAHGWTGQSTRERLIYYPAGKRLLARFPRVIAVSSDIKHDLIRHGARAARVVVILNAIDAAAFRHRPERRPIVRTALGYAPGEIVIGAVGRLERQKRFDLLLDAFAAAAGTRPNLRLVIAGDGSLRGDLSARATALNLGPR